MNFNEFSKNILCKTQLYLGSDYEVSLRNVTKNNGLKLTGIIGRKLESSISPTIYIDQYYKEDITEYDVDYLGLKIANSIKGANFEREDIIEDFLIFEKIKDYIFIKLINAEANKELLLEVPYRRFHNLAIVYLYLADGRVDNTATIMIRNEYLSKWEINENELYERAIINTPKIMPFNTINMRDVINGMSGQKIFDEDFPLYVISNSYKLFGAHALIYDEYMSHVAQILGGSFYIIPSSIHELIVLADDSDRNPKELIEMITQINKTEVLYDEVLADSLYYYDIEEEKVNWIC